MKSYIKIYGPPIDEAIIELEKIALDMPEVCIMNENIELIPSLLAREGGGGSEGQSFISNYFQYRTAISPEVERCNNIISKSGETTGEYDFYFEWFKKPSAEQVRDLIKKIDNALEPLGCKYTITTK
jgi:hypothetical protein